MSLIKVIPQFYPKVDKIESYNFFHIEVIDYLMASGEVGRPLIVSRKVPAERIKILQEAFDATLRDPDFLADAARQNLPISPVDGAEAQRIISKMLSASPDLIDKARLAAKE
jgi:hypothetical protein